MNFFFVFEDQSEELMSSFFIEGWFCKSAEQIYRGLAACWGATFLPS